MGSLAKLDRHMANPLYPLLFSSIRSPDYSLHELGAKPVSKSRLAARERRTAREVLSPEELPDQVKKIDTGENGPQVYVVGTAHLSNASNHQVGWLIDKLQPDRVMVELCEERRGLMYTSQHQVQHVSWAEIKDVIRTKGIGQAMLLLPLLFASSGASNQLHSMPGAEFRVAREHCSRVPGCSTVLGDRRLSTTVARMFRLMSPYEKVKFVGSMLWDAVSSISSDEIESMKDEVGDLLEEMRTGYPGVYRVILDERNVYLTAMLQATARQPQKLDRDEVLPPVVVAVVGIGHQAGILEMFNTPVTRAQFEELKSIPEHSLGNKILINSLSLAKWALISWLLLKASRKCAAKFSCCFTKEASSLKGIKIL